MKPLCIDLFCGLGGWAEGFLAQGYDVVGFDNHRHEYWAPEAMPESESAAKPVFVFDERSLYGVEDLQARGMHAPEVVARNGDGVKCPGNDTFKITGKPCGKLTDPRYPSSGTKRQQPRTQLLKYPGQLVIQDVLTLHGSQFRNAAVIVASPPCQEFSYMAMPWSLAKAKAAAIRADETGVKLKELNALFDACFRIQREACEAAGRYIPMIVENVKGAQPWVGRAPWNFGSFYLWGDVPALMPFPRKAQKFNPDGTQHGTGSWFAIADSKNRGAREGLPVEGMKGEGGAWFNDYKTRKERGGNIARLSCNSSKSSARKMASAQIAKIPFALAEHIARVFHPGNVVDLNTKQAVSF